MYIAWICMEQFQKKCARRRNTGTYFRVITFDSQFLKIFTGEPKTQYLWFARILFFDFYRLINFKSVFWTSLFVFILHVSRYWRKEAIGSIWVRCSITSQISQVTFLFLFVYKCALAFHLTSYEYLAISFVNIKIFILKIIVIAIKLWTTLL